MSGGTKMIANGDGTYTCGTNRYILLTAGKASCVQRAGCNSYYFSQEKSACTDDPGTCYGYLKGRAFDSPTEKLCVTAWQCPNEKNGFYMDSHCYTGTQCREHDRYAYLSTRDCIDLEPSETGGFDEGQLQNDIYDCGTKFLDITGDKTKCTESTQCSGVLYEQSSLCLKEKDCGTTYYGYIYDGNGKKECIDEGKCDRYGRTSYIVPALCSDKPPDLAGGKFLGRYTGDLVYECIAGYALKITDMGRCFPRLECQRTEVRIYGEMCLMMPQCPRGYKLINEIQCTEQCD